MSLLAKRPELRPQSAGRPLGAPRCDRGRAWLHGQADAADGPADDPGVPTSRRRSPEQRHEPRTAHRDHGEPDAERGDDQRPRRDGDGEPTAASPLAPVRGARWDRDRRRGGARARQGVGAGLGTGARGERATSGGSPQRRPRRLPHPRRSSPRRRCPSRIRRRSIRRRRRSRSSRRAACRTSRRARVSRSRLATAPATAAHPAPANTELHGPVVDDL